MLVTPFWLAGGWDSLLGGLHGHEDQAIRRTPAGAVHQGQPQDRDEPLGGDGALLPPEQEVPDPQDRPGAHVEGRRRGVGQGQVGQAQEDGDGYGAQLIFFTVSSLTVSSVGCIGFAPVCPSM